MSKESIKVLCRIRPVNQREKESGFKQCLAYNSETVKINVIFFNSVGIRKCRLYLWWSI